MTAPNDETSAGAEPGRATSELERGDVVGRYVVLSELGRGGMGVVYAAYDPELDRKVALKLLHASTGGSRDSDGHRRLVREAQAMARLSHPNVITVHDVGEHQGRVYVAMEFVEGETLRAWLDKVRTWPSVLDVFVRAGRGLSAAHEKDLVHRDFKPDNVMVGTDGRVRVMDFGLARPQSAAPGGSQPHRSAESKDQDERDRVRPHTDALGSDLTRQGSIVGTPAYMAPEQHLGLATDVRTDQFSFCVALWESLYGKRPFGGETMVALAFNVTQGKLREVPSGTKIPGWLRVILTRGLSVDPGDRFASMAALLDAAEQGATRRRTRLIAGAAAAVVLVTLGALGGWELDRERRRTICTTDADAISEVWNDGARARLREAVVGTDVSYAETTFEHAVPFVHDYVTAWREHYVELCVATEADGARSDDLWAASRHCLTERRAELASLIDVLTEQSDATSIARTVGAVAGLARLEPCADDAWLARNPAPADATSAGPAGEALPMLSRARALEAAGHYEEGLALAREIVEATAGHGSVRLRVQALQAAGVLAERSGAFAEARERLSEAFDLALASGEDHLALGAANGLTSTVGVWMARKEEGLLWARVARGLHTRGGGEPDLAKASLHNNLGVLYRRQSRYDEAERAHHKALSVRKQVLGPDHPRTARSYLNLGGVYQSQGRYGEAERAFASAVGILEKAFGAEHPVVASAYSNLGGVYHRQGRYDEAERTHKIALSAREQALGPDHPQFATSLVNLAVAYHKQGRQQEAEHANLRALSIMEKALGPEHPDLANAHGNLGTVYQALGRYPQAERAFQRALFIREKALGPDHPRVANSYNNLGLVYHMQGRHQDAERAHHKALSIREKALGPDHPDVSMSHNNLGASYALQGRVEEAERAHQQALSIQEKALGPDHPDLAYSLVGLAGARLEIRRTEAAVLDAERTVELCTNHEVDPTRLAEARFVLARALWQANSDRTRARALAEQARDVYREAGAASSGPLADVERWLVKHGAR